MTDQADETIIVRYVVEAQDAITKAKEFRAQVDYIKTQLKDMAKSSGQAYKELTQGAKTTTQSISSMIGQFVGIGFALAQVRNLIGFLKEAAQAGYEFAKGMYQASIAVNALRRAGTDITFGDVLEQLQKLKSEFGIFATKDLVVGAAAFLNLNRDMGFTKEQLFRLQEAIATLAVVNGRSMEEVQKTVALASSSGYTEGLQRLGVSINRVTIAEEAARLGWDKG